MIIIILQCNYCMTIIDFGKKQVVKRALEKMRSNRFYIHTFGKIYKLLEYFIIIANYHQQYNTTMALQ